MFDGVPAPSGGQLPVSTTGSGHGMSLTAEAEKYRQAPE
jgi:hypothetical protein